MWCGLVSKLSLKQTILAVYHDLHSLLVATKWSTAKLHLCDAEESEIFRKAGVGHFTSDSATLLTNLFEVFTHSRRRVFPFQEMEHCDAGCFVAMVTHIFHLRRSEIKEDGDSVRK